MEALAIWLPSLIISLIAVSSFLYLAYQSRSQIDALKHTLRQTSEQLVKQFLEREKANTQRRIRGVVDSTAKTSRPTEPPADDQVDTATRWLPELRRCWLDAELAALVDHGHGNSSYELLQHNAAPLLRLMQRQAKPDSKAAWNGDETRQYLRKTRDAVASQKQFIAEFRARAAGMGKKPKAEHPEPQQDGLQEASGFIRSMEHMESSTNDLMQTIERLERELAAAQGKYDIIKGRLDALETIRATRDASVQLAERLSTSAAAPAPRADTELLVDMESAYSNSINEMKKMSDINRQQRQLILQMEKELLLLRKDSVEQHAATEVLDKLKLQLRDYENCTTILEMESETLREQISNLRRSIDASGAAVDSEPVAVPEPPASISQNGKMHGISLDLLESIAQADSLEDAATRIVGWLQRQGITSVIFLKGSREQAWTASDGRVDDHSRQLLKSIVPVNGKPISEVREGVMFTYSVCRILLYGKGEFHERGSQVQVQLRDNFAAVDPIIQLLQDRIELRQQHRQMEKIQQKIQSLLVQYNYIDGEYTRTEADFRKELKEYLSTSATTEVQRQCIDTMLEDFDSQLEILSRTGKLIGNGLKAAIQELSRIDSTAAG
jgi:hypothetical protein